MILDGSTQFKPRRDNLPFLATMEGGEFKARFPWLGGDLQTLRASLMPKPPCPPVVDRFQVDLTNWAGSLNCAVGGSEHARNSLVLFHGLGGHEDSVYLRRTASAFHAAGWRTYRVNARGVGPSKATSTGPYSGGLTGDAFAVLKAVTERHKKPPYAMGFSLGGQLILRTLGEYGQKAADFCAGAVTVSAPLDLKKSVAVLEKARNRLYHAYLVRHMKRDLVQAFGDKILPLTSIRQIDHHLIGPTFGYESAEDYYYGISCGQLLGDVSVPTLTLHAQDDPWIPADDYLDSRYYPSNPCLYPLITRSGGHVGFMDRKRGDSYVSDVSLKFFEYLRHKINM